MGEPLISKGDPVVNVGFVGFHRGSNQIGCHVHGVGTAVKEVDFLGNVFPLQGLDVIKGVLHRDQGVGNRSPSEGGAVCLVDVVTSVIFGRVVGPLGKGGFVWKAQVEVNNRVAEDGGVEVTLGIC